MKINAHEAKLRYDSGETYQAIADSLGVSKQGVVSAIRKARAEDPANEIVNAAMPGIRRALLRSAKDVLGAKVAP